jgi:taurine dioxygenase
LGAEVIGLEPRVPLDPDTLAQLSRAFDEHSVIVFRDFDCDEAFQRWFVWKVIGEEPPTPLVLPTTQRVSNKTEGGSAPYGRLLFHCDTMWAKTPEPIVSLYAESAEPPSVPTMFASMVHAWETLPEHLKARVAGLEARHGHEHQYPNRGGDDDVIDAYYEHAQSCVKPIAFRHPRTGKTMLYVSQQVTIEILGLPPEENEALLEELFAHLYRPENVLAHEWRTGDLVCWDNIAAQHARGTVALEGPERTLRKVFGPVPLTEDERAKPSFSKLPG